jgi:hypothetical protein
MAILSFGSADNRKNVSTKAAFLQNAFMPAEKLADRQLLPDWKTSFPMK